MSRPLRIEQTDGWYHVMNRGARRQAIYLTEVDRTLFLRLLGRTAARYDIRVYAYCLMSNHFHLLLKTPRANLSASMHWFLSSYVRRFNRQNQIDGPLFRGRFKAILVETGAYVTNASRYIHRNPVAAGVAASPIDYPHSSLPALVGAALRPPWLHSDPLVLPEHEQTDTVSLWLTETSPADIETDRFYEAQRVSPVMGTDAFKRRMHRSARSDPETSAERGAVLARPSIETIESVISEVFGPAGAPPITDRCPAHRNTLEVRAAIYLGRLVGGCTLADLARRYGYRGYSGASSAFARFGRDLESPAIAQLLAAAAVELGAHDRQIWEPGQT